MKALQTRVVIFLATVIFFAVPAAFICHAATGSDHRDHLVAMKKLGHYSKATPHAVAQQKTHCRPESFFGAISPDRETVYTNCEGKTLYGRIDANGYGTLVDDAGNLVNVQPER